MTRVGVEAELDAGRLVHVPLRHARGLVRSELGLFTRAASALPMAAETFVEYVKAAMNESAVGG